MPHHAGTYAPPPEAVSALRAWQKFIARQDSKTKSKQPNESDLHEQFFTDVFVDAFGYQRRKAGIDVWTLASEYTTDVDAKRPDGVLGTFTEESAAGGVHVVIELKSLGTDLDLRQKRADDKRTPVEQAFSYAHKFDAVEWVIVSNFQELRLYHSKSSKYAQRFDLTNITDSEQSTQLGLLLLLLRAENMLPIGQQPSATDQLYARREAELKSITDQFYDAYKSTRLATWDAIRAHHHDPSDSIRLAQKVMDRILFVAFLEDTPHIKIKTIERAMVVNPFQPTPIWDNFKGLFKGLDQGSKELGLPAYNGGLFRYDPILDSIPLPNVLMQQFARLAKYDFASDLSVNILGHVFEQSITDLALLRAEAGGQQVDTLQHDKGVHYTPNFVTEYLVDAVLTPYLATIRNELGEGELAELTEEEITKGNRNENVRQHIEFWEAYLARIKALRILDPSCGSGAFLVATFDYLVAEGKRINKELLQLNAPMLFANFQSDILKENLYGVDISAEAVEITSLSLWLKIANKSDPLVSLDKNIRVGNAVVDDPAVDPENAFDWHKEFPGIMAAGGFDIVVGNPPYVRQELISSWKPAFQKSFKTYHGYADLYVYFYELGHQLLKEGGRLGYISSNKFFRTGYGENLRSYLTQQASIETVLDLSHIKNIFRDANVDPAIVVFGKQARKQEMVLVQNRTFHGHTAFMSQHRLTQNNWILEDNRHFEVIKKKMHSVGTPLKQWQEVQINFGIKTGFNDAFLINDSKRTEIIAQNPDSIDCIKPSLHGRDIQHWHHRMGLWLIFIPNGWTDANRQSEAPESFVKKHYPAIYQHLKTIGAQPIKRKSKGIYARTDQGDYWWELRPCAYSEAFEQPKIIFTEIKKGAAFMLDTEKYYSDGTTNILLAKHLEYLLALFNSRLVLWYAFTNFGLLGDDRIRWKKIYLMELPLPIITEEDQKPFIELSHSLTAWHRQRETIRTNMLEVLSVEFAIQKFPTAFKKWHEIEDSKTFLLALNKTKKKLSPIQKLQWQEMFNEQIARIRALDTQIAEAEAELNTRVEDLYGLTPAERKYYRAAINKHYPK